MTEYTPSSYETHILKQANVIDEGVKNFAEAQTSFNREVIQKFPELNESFIAHLNPVSTQLDRLENSSQMSSASISSLASDVSRILNLISSNPALAVSAKSKTQDEKMESEVATATSPHSSFARPKFDLPELPLSPSKIDSSGGDRLIIGDQLRQGEVSYNSLRAHMRSGAATFYLVSKLYFQQAAFAASIVGTDLIETRQNGL